ncbi:hypothetical protein PINS_up019928 [Pythium insidiosum]|nr:hypothetical protein PINS_up019928 [Pythium insidiosum]
MEHHLEKLHRALSHWPRHAPPRRLCAVEAVRAPEFRAHSCSSRWLSSAILLPLATALQSSDPRALRAFVDLVVRLSETPTFQWRDQDASFWLRALPPSSCFLDQRLLHRGLLTSEPTQDTSHTRPRFIVDLMDERQPACDCLQELLSFLTAQSTDEKAEHQHQHQRHRTDVSIDFVISPSRRIQELRRVLEAFAAHDDSRDSVQLVVSGLSLSSERAVLSAEEWTHVACILAIDSPRVRVRHLLVQSKLLSPEDLAAVQRFLVKLTQAPSVPLEALTWRSLRSSHAFHVAVFSLLRSGRVRLKTLALPLLDHDQRVWWAWFALCVLHPSSLCELERLSLVHAKRTIGVDVAALVDSIVSSLHPALDVLAVENPSVFALVEKEGNARNCPSPGSLSVTLSPAAVAHAAPTSQSPVLMSTDELKHALEVVVELTEWTCVIVPGVGFAWIENAVVLERNESKHNATSVKMQSLSWDLAEDTSCHRSAFDNPETFVRIAHYVAADLVHLSIHGDLVASSERLAAVLEACSSLQHLSIQNVTSDTIPAIHRLCRPLVTLELELELNSVVGAASAAAPVLLAAFLRAKTGQALQQLRLRGLQGSARELQPLINAIQQHQTLEYFQPSAAHDFSGSYEMKVALRELRTASLVRSGPLPLAARLAFLSVLRRKDNRAAIAQLDAAITSVVFQFAAAWRPFQLHVH